MEEIEVLKLGNLIKECEWLEPYWWYSHLLQKHVVVNGKVDGCPLPQYVLKSLSHKKSTFVSPDMETIVLGIADVAACAVKATEAGKKLKRKALPQMEKTFNTEEMAQLRSSTKQLQAATNGYSDVIARIRKQQKKCWKLGKVAGKKLAIMDSHQRNGERVMAKLQQQFLSSYEELLKNLTLFMALRDKAQAIKGQMKEISTAIKRTVVSAIEEKAKTSIKILTQVIEAVDTSLPTTHILDSLLGIDTRTVATDVFNSVSETYCYPNIEDYHSYPGFSIAIPKTEWKKSRMLFKIKKRTMCGETIVYQVIGKTDEEMLPEFFETKKKI